MIKKIIFSLLCFIPVLVSASVTPLVRIGGRFYDTLEDAVNAATENSTITLISDVELKDTLEINKVINIDLNGNDITSKEKVFQVKGGFLTLTGKGTIKETEPNYGAIMLIGSSEPTNEKYSSVSVGSDVTLEGWSGIFITHEANKSYGVNAYVEGKINAVNDTSGGSGIGIYVNGNIKDENDSPVINIMDGAIIKSTGNGLYIAGYSTFYIGDAYIEGHESAVGIKSGKLIIDGATLVCNGEDATPTEGYNNGIKDSGTTIQIESNNGYAGNIEIDISSGEFISKNSNVIYEYIGRGNSSLIYSMSISGGTFKGAKEVFSFSQSFKDMHSGFISGGKYSSDPSSYLKSGYTAISEDGLYNVVKSTLKDAYSSNVKSTSSNPFIKILITFTSIIVLIVLYYINRLKINKFFKKIF